MTQTTVQERVAEQINGLQIAGYLKEEALACLKYLTTPKLKNIEKNLTCFCDYLLFLNQQNTEHFLNLAEKEPKTSASQSRDLAYFFATGAKITPKQQKSYLQKIADQGLHVLNLMQGLRGLLVLTIDEFCNASATRIDIHKLLMQGKCSSSSCLAKKQSSSCKTKPTSSKTSSKKPKTKKEKPD